MMGRRKGFKTRGGGVYTQSTFADSAYSESPSKKHAIASLVAMCHGLVFLHMSKCSSRYQHRTSTPVFPLNGLFLTVGQPWLGLSLSMTEDEAQVPEVGEFTIYRWTLTRLIEHNTKVLR